MQAPAEETLARPVSAEVIKRSKWADKLSQEVEADSSLVSSGARLMNRPRDNSKDRFIVDFVKQQMIDKFPLIASDLAEEVEVEWSLNPAASLTMMQVAIAEVEASFTTAGAQPPVSSFIIALKILTSDHGPRRVTLADVALSELDVSLVLAHIVALGYRWPPRIAIALARRLTVVILNRQKFEEGKIP